jgi:HlyD family secretion protein
LHGAKRLLTGRDFALTFRLLPMASDKQTLDQLKIHRPVTAARGARGSLVLTVLVLVVAGVAIWWWWQRPHATEVETSTAQRMTTGGARTLLNASGYVTARRAATASSKVTGRVIDVLIEEGMVVNEGQVLAHVDSSNVESSLRLAEAQLESQRKGSGETEANLDLSERELDRARHLAESKVVSESDLDRAEAEVKTLRARLARQSADVAVAERQLALWQQQLDDTIIRAPFGGVVVSKNAQPGEMISPLSAGGGFTRTGVCTIVDMSSLEVEVDVNESYINRVEAGQPVVVTLDSYPEWKIPAKVVAIIPTADRQKATVRVRVGFEKLDSRILPDMGLKVAFQSSTAGDEPSRQTVVVPKAAVRRVDDRDVVWIVRDGKLERRAVTVESTQSNEATLAAGLNGGEAVIVNGPDTLVEGAPARIKSP